jgi:hypothetical protein
MSKSGKPINNELNAARSGIWKSAVAGWIVPNVVMLAVLAFAITTNMNDPAGWSFFYTFPIYIAAGILFILDAILFITLALKAPKENRKRRRLYWLGAFISLLPIILVVSYITLSSLLQNAAWKRATTPVSLQEARQLITDCRVETLHRDDDGGDVGLNENVPVLPGSRTHPERRTFNVDYYDELFALARSKDVQDRCGFVPTYDITRPRQPEVKKWITQPEAEGIISRCLWNTNFYLDNSYFRDVTLPEPNTTGILLLQRLSVWNDDTESTIILINADGAVKTSLQEKQAACPKGY